MTTLRVLNQTMVKNVLSLADTIQTVESVYKSKAEQTSTIWPMIFYEFEPGQADMDIKSGFMKELGIYGLKLVSWYGANPKKNLPALYGTTMLFDAENGKPIGLVDAEYITGMRTGAAGAIGSKWLARKDSETLLMVGTGHQALFQLLSHLLVMPNLKQLYICDPLEPQNELNFVKTCKEKLKALVKQTESFADDYVSTIDALIIEACVDLAEKVPKSDIIVTATPARTPFIKAKWVKPGTHFSCVGADMSGKQEVDQQLFAKARIIVDDLHQAITVGETETAIKKQVITEQEIAGEIGAVILGQIEGRRTAEEITIYDTTGIALQDLAVTKQVLDQAEKMGIGQLVDL
ncbi:ornithine cyclodeaminase family protein [Enterococcus sp. LJL99]